MKRSSGVSGLSSPLEVYRFLFSQALEISHDMAIILDLEGRIAYVNPAAGEILGYRPNEVTGQFLWDIVIDLDQIARMMEMTLEYGQWGGEVTCSRKEGVQVPVRLRTVLIQTKEGEILGIVGMGWDLTPQKEMEAQMVRLERQRLMGEMASGVAHNFNNVLVGILGNAQLLERHEDLPSDVRNLIRVIVNSAEKASELVHRIQQSARGGEGDRPPVPVNLNEVVEACVEATRPRWKTQSELESRPVEIEVDLQAVRPVDGRTSEVDEVLTNLVFNAVDAMPEGGKIRIRTWDEEESVCLSVTDTGVGMDRETQRRLGELFFTTKGDQGHGLGLAACYRIVEQMSGRIEVGSAPEEGTTFTLRFPVGQAAASHPRSIPFQTLPPCSILVVEDDEQIQDFLKIALSECRVEIAAGGEAGLALFRAGQYDVVLVDLSMPGMNGVMVAREIRKIDPDVPIALMTGWGEPPKGAADLFQAVLSKPFTVQVLKQFLAEILGA